MKFLYEVRVRCKLIAGRLLKKGIPSFCKNCGIEVRDFDVPDDIWKIIDPYIKHGHVLCYNCFSDICGSLGLPRNWKLVNPSDDFEDK